MSCGPTTTGQAPDLPAGTVGLLGGAFDPPHRGHLTVARESLRQLALSRLLVVVTGTAPHKMVETSAEVRLRLAELAFAGLERAVLSRIEIDRPGRSYTLDTVRWSRAEYGETTFIIGADEFASFLDWHEPDGVLEAAHLAVATRPGFSRETLEPVLSGLAQPDRVHFFSIPEVRASSREIRELVRDGGAISGLVEPAVEQEIGNLGLYRDEPADERLPSQRMDPTCEAF